MVSMISRASFILRRGVRGAFGQIVGWVEVRERRSSSSVSWRVGLVPRPSLQLPLSTIEATRAVSC